MATIRVSWKLNGSFDAHVFPIDSLWTDVREEIQLREGEGRALGTRDIHVRNGFFRARFDRG